jgi:hypothetical protein
MSVLLYPTCPTDCAGLLPEPLFVDCAPELRYGEIEWLIIARADAAPFNNIEDLIEWNARVALANTDHNAISIFHVIADLPEPEVTETTISGDRTVRGDKKFTLPFTIDELNDQNYEAHLTIECGNQFLFWFVTADGHIYNGNEGQLASMLTNLVIPRERTALVTIVGKMTWTNKRSPLIGIYPLA